MSLQSSFLRHVAQTSPEPDGFEVSRGEGIYLFDQHGKPFIDCISGITVSSFGHGHPRIIEAIKRQLDIHLHTQVYGEHIVAPQVRLAEGLASVLPGLLSTTYFVNSGAEAVEGAIKLAKKFTTRNEVIACRNAYHGSTATGDSLRSDTENTSSSRPLVPGVYHIEFNNTDDLSKINERTAAVIIEPIQGEAGVKIPAPGYLAQLKKKCNDVGCLLIFDEIQTGMGRTGNYWAFEFENVIPDILLLGKAFGGGLPLAAFISSPEIMKRLSDPPLGHMTTFGGNALCCAASLEALNILIDNELHLNAQQQGQVIVNTLQAHKNIRDIRGRGLMLAIELAHPEHLQPAINSCRKEGLLVDWFLFNNSSIRLAPPLTIRTEEVEILCDRLLRALDAL